MCINIYYLYLKLKSILSRFLIIFMLGLSKNRSVNMKNIIEELEKSKKELREQMANNLRLMIQDLQVCNRKLDRVNKKLSDKIHGGKNG